MSQVNLNPLQSPVSGNDLPGVPASLPQSQGSQSATPPAAPPSPTGDSVQLSAASQTPNPAATGGPQLSDSEATTASVDLRQQLGTQSLSVGARQNQAILSLLRG